MKSIIPWMELRRQKSHSITSDAMLSPITKKPRAHVIPRMGRRTKEE